MKAQAEKIVDHDVDSEHEFEQAKESAREAYTKFQEARSHLKSAALNAGVDMKESANDFLEEKVGTINENGQELYEEAGKYIKENPVKSTGIAFLAGFIVSKILK